MHEGELPETRSKLTILEASFMHANQEEWPSLPLTIQIAFSMRLGSASFPALTNSTRNLAERCASVRCEGRNLRIHLLISFYPLIRIRISVAAQQKAISQLVKAGQTLPSQGTPRTRTVCTRKSGRVDPALRLIILLALEANVIAVSTPCAQHSVRMWISCAANRARSSQRCQRDPIPAIEV